MIAVFLHVAALKHRIYKQQTASNLRENDIHATDEDDQLLTRTLTVRIILDEC